MHNRVWPDAQKNAVFRSHLRSLEVSPRKAEQGILESWIVFNKSSNNPTTPIGQGGCHRVNLAVCSFCLTVVQKGRHLEKLSRKELLI